MKKLLATLLALCMLFALCAISASAEGVGGTAYPNPLQDVRVRQALWYAIDMDAIVDALWNGTVTAAAATPSGLFTIRATCLTRLLLFSSSGQMSALRWSSSC